MPASSEEESNTATTVQLHTKLYGSKAELEKRATFILQTGGLLSVAATEKKSKIYHHCDI